MEQILNSVVQQLGQWISQIDTEKLKNVAGQAGESLNQAAQNSGFDIAGLGQYSWFIVGIVLVFLIYKLVSLPFKFVIKAIIGYALLFCVNFVGAYFNFAVPINLATILIAGIFWLPGVIGILIYYIFVA